MANHDVADHDLHRAADLDEFSQFHTGKLFRTVNRDYQQLTWRRAIFVGYFTYRTGGDALFCRWLHHHGAHTNRGGGGVNGRSGCFVDYVQPRLYCDVYWFFHAGV